MDFVVMPYFDFLVLFVPGFVAVFTYHKLARLEMIFNVKFFMLSFLSGLGTLFFFELLLWKQSRINDLLKNPYAAAILLSIFAIEFGTGLAWLKRDERRLKEHDEFIKKITGR